MVLVRSYKAIKMLYDQQYDIKTETSVSGRATRIYPGPFLFLSYINDFSSCLHYTTPSMYTDDTQVSVTVETELKLEDIFNRDSESMEEWLQANKPSINAVKIEFIIMTSSH